MTVWKFFSDRARGRWLAWLGLGAICCGGIGWGVTSTKSVEPLRSPELLALAETRFPSHWRPRLEPNPASRSTDLEIWECDVAIIGGSLGGVSAAAQVMQSGATACLIEVAPWLGGQISTQGVSAIDESLTMRQQQNFSRQWQAFKRLIEAQPIAHLPGKRVADTNACWVGDLCFPPKLGDVVARAWLERAAARSPQSRWTTATAFKGADFNATGREITAIYGVKRVPRSPDYAPEGHFSRSLGRWYSWGGDDRFEKIPLKLQAPAGKRLLVIDATDTGELVGWAGIPHRLGSDSRATTGEVNAADWDNPECTQAFTYPFVVAIADDGGRSLAALKALELDKSGFSAAEHRQEFSLGRTPAFVGRSFFHYRRILSITGNDPVRGRPANGDWTLVNWNPGNDWNWMNPPAILTAAQLKTSGQRQNWLGGISPSALRNAEDRALIFARWLLETQSQPGYPLSYLAGVDSPMGTQSGLSLTPYIREGRRILGRAAYGQEEFYLREADLRRDLPGGRDFSKTAVAIAHYDIDIHGCRYRNWGPSGEARSAPKGETAVRPLQIPLESLIPQGIDNVLIGGKSIAVSHIANAITRLHYSEWGVGGAAGSTATWLLQHPELTPAEIIPNGQMPALHAYFKTQGLQFTWD